MSLISKKANDIQFLGLPSMITSFYVNDLSKLSPRQYELKLKLMQTVWNTLDKTMQHDLRILFEQIYDWHVNHTDVTKTDFDMFAAILCLPMVRCPYLESLNAYDIITSSS